MKISEIVYDKSKYSGEFIQKMCHFAKQLNCTELSAFRLYSVMFAITDGNFVNLFQLTTDALELVALGMSVDGLIAQMLKNESENTD